jgi:predicted DsbA family dithiol-disulfide isomerase
MRRMNSSDDVRLLERVDLWVDPSCPWCWQTTTWLRELRDRDVITIAWKLFSLELNAGQGVDFWDASPFHGEAHTALALAYREGGDPSFEALYAALGALLHDQGDKVSPQLIRKAAVDAGLEGIVERSVEDPSVVVDILEGQNAARDRGVFGVPTFTVAGSKPIYGPILAVAPAGDDALGWWEHVRWLTTRPDFFELKRWPRDLRPGQPPPPHVAGNHPSSHERMTER